MDLPITIKELIVAKRTRDLTRPETAGGRMAAEVFDTLVEQFAKENMMHIHQVETLVVRETRKENSRRLK